MFHWTLPWLIYVLASFYAQVLLLLFLLHTGTSPVVPPSHRCFYCCSLLTQVLPLLILLNKSPFAPSLLTTQVLLLMFLPHIGPAAPVPLTHNCYCSRSPYTEVLLVLFLLLTIASDPVPLTHRCLCSCYSHTQLLLLLLHRSYCS